MANQPYDEAVDVSSDGTHGIGMQSKNEEESDASSASEDNEDPGGPVGMAPAQPKSAQSNQSAEDDEESETSSDDDGDDDGSAPADGYDPSEYANLDVSEEVQERLFEPFFTTARTEGGTGMGLPIIQAMLVARDGSIEFVGGKGGAVFLVRLGVVG